MQYKVGRGSGSRNTENTGKYQSSGSRNTKNFNTEIFNITEYRKFQYWNFQYYRIPKISVPKFRIPDQFSGSVPKIPKNFFSKKCKKMRKNLNISIHKFGISVMIPKIDRESWISVLKFSGFGNIENFGTSVL